MGERTDDDRLRVRRGSMFQFGSQLGIGQWGPNDRMDTLGFLTAPVH
jgi:hypothetical protein